MSIHNTEKPVNPSTSTHVVILGSGFSGIEVLKKLQKEFDTDTSVEITLISKDNFILFTPMLPEVASGMIETRNIVTPVRSFCKKAKFHQAKIESIDLISKKVTLTHPIGRQSQPNDWREHILKYDYLVIALGSENNYFKMRDVQRYSFTMKSIDDAIVLRNHIINVLEQASLEEENIELRRNLLTFVVAGGGFNGVETVGAINDFIRDSIKDYYKNINMSEVRVILIDTNEKLLAEVDEELGKFALERLKVNGVEFMMKCPVTGATANTIKLYNGTIIPCYTLIWSAGVTPSKLVAELPCEHDRGHRIVANSYLEVPSYNGVYALGDCASITDPHTGKPYPPTAQHAIRQAKVATKNIISAVKGEKGDKNKIKFDYKTKGMMAEIGKRTGVAILFNKIKLHGFLAWWLWRTYYLANLPTTRKKLKVLGDWISDLIFKPDVSMITRDEKESEEEQEKIN
ncbi:MAG: NAD(P)/FAD-dependent oxidoreductase [Candidatus Nitrosopolaris sp.]|jgi:NADH:ubiquinone reductase (H+-translocating)